MILFFYKGFHHNIFLLTIVSSISLSRVLCYNTTNNQVLEHMNLKTVLQGIAMGVAELIPGVSGSTIALILGVYDNFIAFLSQVSEAIKIIPAIILRKKSFADGVSSFKKINFSFGIPLFIGMAITIIGLSRFLKFAIEGYPQFVYAFFTGLVVMSLSVPWDRIKKPTLNHYTIVGICTGVFWIIFSIQPLEALVNPPLWALFVGGAVAICAMILPGVSGSFLLLVFGLYQPVLSLVSRAASLDSSAFIPLFVFIAGIIVGFLSFIKGLNYVLDNHSDTLMAILTGLLIASFRIMWPFFEITDGIKDFVYPVNLENSILIGIGIFFIAGVVLVAVLKSVTNKV